MSLSVYLHSLPQRQTQADMRTDNLHVKKFKGKDEWTDGHVDKQDELAKDKGKICRLTSN